MFTLLHLFLRFLLAVSIGGFVAMAVTSPEQAHEVVAEIEGTISFPFLLMILGGVVAGVFFLDVFFGAFWDSEEGWKIRKLQTLLTSQAPRSRKIRGLIAEDEWGAKLHELNARFHKNFKPIFTVLPPDEKGYSMVNLTVADAGYSCKRRVASRSARNAERLIHETKIRMFHEFVASVSQQQTVEAVAPPPPAPSAEPASA